MKFSLPFTSLHQAAVALTSPKAMLASAASSLTSTELAVLFSIFLFGFLVFLALIIIIIVSLWQIYRKAGRPAWASIVPFYNKVVLLDMVGLPVWWIVLLFIPIVNIVIGIIVLRRLAGCFGHDIGFTVGLILLPFVFFPLLAFGHAQYHPAYPPAGPMTEGTKWAIIAFALFLMMENLWFSTHILEATRPQPLVKLDPNTGYAQDGAYVYYYDDELKDADPDTFKVIGEYGVDRNSVYYSGSIVDGANPDTFTVNKQNGSYASDDTNVYYSGTLIDGADPTSFKLVGQDGYAVDSSHVYYDGTLVPNADPSTFEPIPYDYNGPEQQADAKDANHYYEYGNIFTPTKASTKK